MTSVAEKAVEAYREGETDLIYQMCAGQYNDVLIASTHNSKVSIMDCKETSTQRMCVLKTIQIQISVPKTNK